MQLLLIRHGQSANNAGPDHERVCDPGLTEIGVQQAEHTANFLQDDDIDHLYCSPFLRALETVRPLAMLKEQTVTVNPHIFEKGGCYSGHDATQKVGEPGMGRDELLARYPGWQIDEEISSEGWWGRPYESWEECRARAARVAKWITHELTPHAGRHAMVIHADFKAELLPAILAITGCPTPEPEALCNTGISELHFENQAWILKSFNSTSHLPDNLVTR